MVNCALKRLKSMFKNESRCNNHIQVCSHTKGEVYAHTKYYRMCVSVARVRVCHVIACACECVTTHTVEDQLLTVTAILEQLMFAIGTF